MSGPCCPRHGVGCVRPFWPTLMRILCAAVVAVFVVGCGKSRSATSVVPAAAASAGKRTAGTRSTEAPISPTGVAAEAGDKTRKNAEKQGFKRNSVDPGVATAAAAATAASLRATRAWLAVAGVRLPTSQSPSRRLAARRRGDRATAAVRLGRKGLWLYNKRLLPADCRGRRRACTARRGLADRIRLRRRDLGAPTAEGPLLIPTLARAARHLRGKDVLLLADVDVRMETVMQVLATLGEVGARPQLGALGALDALGDGGLVALWPADAPHDGRLPRRAPAGETAPRDIEGLTVELANDGVTLVLQRGGGGYMRRSPPTAPWRAVSDWAARLAALPRPVRGGLVAAMGDISVSMLVRAVDALIAPCLFAGCEQPAQRLRTWQLIRLNVGGRVGDVDPPQPPAELQHREHASGGEKFQLGPKEMLRPEVRAGRPHMGGYGLQNDLQIALPRARTGDLPIQPRRSP